MEHIRFCALLLVSGKGDCVGLKPSLAMRRNPSAILLMIGVKALQQTRLPGAIRAEDVKNLTDINGEVQRLSRDQRYGKFKRHLGHIPESQCHDSRMPS
jgi:hypothetical protein